MTRFITTILILGIFSGWASLCQAQTDPKSPVSQTIGVNPSGAATPSPLDDPKLTPEQRASLKNRSTFNPSNPPVPPPDPKQPRFTSDTTPEKEPVRVEQAQSLQELPASAAKDREQPEGEKPAQTTTPEIPVQTGEQAIPADQNDPNKEN